jgi:RNA polymerase sigma factor (sigma-70 family)
MNAEELAGLYRRLAPLIHARAHRILGQGEDGVVRDVFLRMLQRQTATPDPFAWIYNATNTACLSRLKQIFRRDPSRMPAILRILEEHRDESVPELLARPAVFQAVLAHAGRKVRRTAILLLGDQMTLEEAAQLLQVSTKTVSRTRARFLAQAEKLVNRWKSEITSRST